MTGGESAPHAALIRSALEALPVGLVVEDRDGSQVFANAAATSTGSYHGDALLRSALAEAFTAAAAGDWEPRTVELHGSGGRTYSVHAHALADDGRAVVVTDMSERQRLDQVKRDFVANVSHELRTPIGAMVLLSETLSGESDEQTLSLLHGHIAEEARRAKRLVDTLLALSKVEGMPSGAGTVVDLGEIVDDAVELVAPLAGAAGISVRVSRDAAAPQVCGDPESLLSAVINLLENAVKYSGSGTEVQISLNSTATEARLSVADRGIGIPARDLGRIFERFYRVDRARSRGTGGAGLGLAIVRHVAENCGGRVSVESREGEGSSFTLCLPLRQQHFATPESS